MSSPTILQISFPFAEPERGRTVLTAATMLFAPDDALHIVIVPDGAVPDEAQVADFDRLLHEVTLPFGSPPPMTLVSPDEAAQLSPVLAVRAGVGVREDVDAITRITGVARQFGSSYGRSPSLRAGGRRLREEVELAQRVRDSRIHRRPTDEMTIVFLIQRLQVWGALDTLVAAARTMSGVRAEVVVLDEHTDSYQRHAMTAVDALLEGRGITRRSEAWLRESLPSVDLVITPDPYASEGNTALGVTPAELAKSGIRVALSPYAQALGGTAENLTMLHNKPFHTLAWRIFAPSDGSRENFADVCAIGAGHVRSLGSPKRERLLVDDAARAAAERLRSQLGTRSIVMWNPHFEADLETSTFGTYVETLVAWAMRNPRVGLIVRPHPRLLPDMERRGDHAAAESFRAACRRTPTILLDESIDAAPAMLAADALVTDLSSLIPEFAALERPIALLRPADGHTLNRDQECLAKVVNIDDVAGLRAFLDSVGPADRSATRTDHPDLGAGERIIAAVLAEWRGELRSR